VKKILLVIIPDRLSDLIGKGEAIDRYYNPDNLFEEVHILMTNDDKPKEEDIQRMAGDAKLYLHNLPSGQKLFMKSLGWQPALLKPWVNKAIKLAKIINPKIIRCYGTYLNSYLGYKIKEDLKVPLIISIHTHPDENRRMYVRQFALKEYITWFFLKKIEKIFLESADCVICVYKSILDYVNKFNTKRVELIYNVINSDIILNQKKRYDVHIPPKLIYVGRVTIGKNPENVILALKGINAVLTLIGNGEYIDNLKKIAHRYNVLHKIEFIDSISNDNLCKIISQYDIFVVHSDFWGIPKTVMEAFLAGLPVIINKKYPPPVEELDGDWVYLVKNTPQGYRDAIEDLLNNESKRKELGVKGREYAVKNFHPLRMEKQLTNIYKDYFI